MRISTTFVALAFSLALGRVHASASEAANEHIAPIARDQQSGDKLIFKTVSLANTHTSTHTKSKTTANSKTTTSSKSTKKQQFDQQVSKSPSSSSSTQRKSTRPSAKPAIPVAQYADPVTLPQHIANYLADVGIPGLLTYKNLSSPIGVEVAIPDASPSSATSSSTVSASISSATTSCASGTNCSGKSQACSCSVASSTTTSSSGKTSSFSSASTISPVTRSVSSSSSSTSTRTKTGVSADLPTPLTTRTIIATVSGIPITTNVLVPMLPAQGVYTIGDNKRPSTSSSKIATSTRAKVAAPVSAGPSSSTSGSGNGSNDGSGSGASSSTDSNAFPGLGQNPVESAVSSLLSVSALNNVASTTSTTPSLASESSSKTTPPSATTSASASASSSPSKTGVSSSTQPAPSSSSFVSNDSLTQSLLEKTHIGTTVDNAVSELKDLLNSSDQASRLHSRQVVSSGQQLVKAGSGSQTGNGDGSSIPDLTPEAHAFVQQQLGNTQSPYAMALEQALAMAQAGVYGTGMSQPAQPPIGIQIYNQPTLIQASNGLFTPTALIAGLQQAASATSSSSSQSTSSSSSTSSAKSSSTASSTSSSKTSTSSTSSVKATTSSSSSMNSTSTTSASTRASTASSTKSSTSSTSSTTAQPSSTSASATSVKLAAPLRLWSMPTTFDSLADFSPIVKFTSGKDNLRVIEGGLPSEAFVQVSDESDATDGADDGDSSSSSDAASSISSSATPTSSGGAITSTGSATGLSNQIKGNKTPMFDGHAVMTASDTQSTVKAFTSSSSTSTSIIRSVSSSSSPTSASGSVSSATSASSSIPSSKSTSTVSSALAQPSVSGGVDQTNATGAAPLRLYRASAAKWVPVSELKAAEAEFLQQTNNEGNKISSRAMRSVLEVLYPAGSSNPGGDIVGGAQFYALTPLALPTNNKTLVNALIANITSLNGTLSPSNIATNGSSRPLPPLLAALVPGLDLAQSNLTSSAPLVANATGTALAPKVTTLDQAKKVTFSYSVWFPPGFNFVKGGKLPGLYGGRESCSGGDPAADCWSSRMMWRANGTGEMYLYVPQQQQDPTLCSIPPMSVCDSNYGVSVGRGSFKYHTGAWTRIQQTMKMGSSPTTPDGGFEVVVDGVSRFKFDKVVYPAMVKGIFFSTFFGGHGDDWATPVDQKAWFRDFKLSIDA
ncbi:hypothetical protein OC845_004738 [Tilletia horrida]|nr:hypothetical protein OC845_004738 [Tilletia horrida]